MNTPFILRNKQFNKLSNKEKENIILQVKQAYIDEGLGINELISKFNSTKTYMYEFLRTHDIKKTKEQLNLERSMSVKKSYASKSKEEINTIKDKRKETNLKKYGVENCYQSEEIKQKIKNTCLEKYGVEHHNQREEVKRKINESTIKSQGAKRYLQTEVGQQKYKGTCLEKYGVENTFQSEEKKDKIKATNLERYGYESAIKNPIVQEKLKQRIQTKYGVDNVLQSLEIQEKVKNTNLERYGVPWYCMTEECQMAQGGGSNVNNRFAELLAKYDITFKREFSLDYVVYDFKIGNTLIEIDPTYTHNSTIGPYFNKHYTKPKDKNYHLNKSIIAQNCGFRCIHIFDWDNIDKIINLLLPKEKIYARDCKIKEVSKRDTDNFLNLYHLQDTCKGQNYRYGLYYNDKLIELMTFGKPRYNKNYEYELLRLCSHKDYKVVGGSKRLFKQFLRQQNPTNIISYCDNSKFSGEVYGALGMTLINQTKPNCIWSKGSTKITDNLLRQRGFDQLFGTNYGKGTSNRELILNEDFVEVYDCGQKVFEWNNK